MTVRAHRFLAFIFTILVLLGALMPGAMKHSVLSPFPEFLHLDKLGHFVGFLLAAFFWLRAGFPRVGVLAVVPGAFVVAAGTETAQLFIHGRTGKPADVLIDVCGACLGLWIARRQFLAAGAVIG